jgi:7,8-dihydroneopterin aldolase/epimerase/oxygenase
MANKKVSIHDLAVYGYHGCLPEEAIIGTNYRIDIDVEFDFELAAQTDDLSKTIDYVVIAKLVKEEMAVRANLIENVCKRIHLAIKKVYPAAGKITVQLFKSNPPAEAEIEHVSVTISE